MRFPAFVLGGLGLFLYSSPAIAEDCTAPCAGFEISTELQNDWLFAANPSFLTSNVLQPTITGDYYFAPVEYVKLVTSIVTEPVVDPAPGESAVFEGVGTYVGELYAVVETDPIALRAGKFDTIFSLASEVDPGISVTNLASNFDTDERWGAETTLGFKALDLNHSLAATLFTTDRTFLSESLITNRGKTRLSDGGAGNTEGISSFSIALNGCKGAEPGNCYEDGDFGYRIGFRHQRAGHATPEQIEDELTPQSEQAFLAAGTARFEIDDETTLRLLGETAYLRHFEGDRDDALIVTGSAALERDRMRYIATYTQQLNLLASESDTRAHLVDFEAIYSSEDDTPIAGATWALGAAYTFTRDDEHQDSHMLSVRATFDLGGNFEFGK